MTDELQVDPASFTVAEWQLAEQVTGRKPSVLLGDLDDEASAVLAWLTLRRDDPTVGLDDVRSQVAGVEQGDDLPPLDVDVMARVCVALRIGPDEFRAMTPVEVAAVVNVLDGGSDDG